MHGLLRYWRVLTNPHPVAHAYAPRTCAAATYPLPHRGLIVLPLSVRSSPRPMPPLRRSCCPQARAAIATLALWMCCARDACAGVVTYYNNAAGCTSTVHNTGTQLGSFFFSMYMHVATPSQHNRLSGIAGATCMLLHPTAVDPDARPCPSSRADNSACMANTLVNGGTAYLKATCTLGTRDSYVVTTYAGAGCTGSSSGTGSMCAAGDSPCACISSSGGAVILLQCRATATLPPPSPSPTPIADALRRGIITLNGVGYWLSTCACRQWGVL
ncbi:MAG: hypothetical protein EOO65_00250 [Methanosarcinales archaeon]|nr:MAG: hypothetical protein EOO65_00250 [Methanosarcinales archaeon]